MHIRRIFLGLDQPALLAAAQYLLNTYRNGFTADLSNIIVVVPGRRAGRRLLEIIVEVSEAGRLLLTPPLIETVGKVPEQLYTPQRPFADDLTQDLAWKHALQTTPDNFLAPVIPNPPDDADEERWLELGRLFRRQHVELAADAIDFGEVARRGEMLEGFHETARWQAMAVVQERFHRVLDGLELWDKQTARLVAIQKQECHTDRDLVVIGTVDMNVATRKMLDQVAGRVTALIFAPEDWSDRFDEHGCLIPEAWQNAAVPLAPEQVDVVSSPNDQALAVLRHIASYEGKYGADEITIGVPDERLIPDINRVLETRGLTTRWGPGRSLLESGPCTFLAILADYLGNESFRGFAAFVRHPDVETWLNQGRVPPGWLSELDEYHANHLPYRLQQTRWLGPREKSERLQAAYKAVQGLLKPINSTNLLITRWPEPLLRILSEVYGARRLQRLAVTDRSTLAACEAIRDILASYSNIPESLQPRLSAARVIRWTLDQLSNVPSPAPADESAIEMLGWLELPLDDAPALVVTSLNEAFIPDSLNSDLFLPNSLRTQLGLLDNPRRYARDAYALSVMLESREDLHVIVGRRNHDGDPMVPSRLLFATEGNEIAERALHFFSPVADEMPSQPTPIQKPTDSAGEGLKVPQPQPLDTPVTRMSVTSFRDYIACPYRYYLRHILKLRAAHDHADELDGAAFGSLAHDVLRTFGSSHDRDSTDVEQIRRILHEALNQCVAKEFGRNTMAVVHVQVEQLRLRLNAFAEKQAQWAAQGWRIEHTEVPTDQHQTAELIVDGEPMQLTGRIDRIDVNEHTGERLVFDYKTSDASKSPEDAHQHRGEWVDLQLPLYRHLLQALGIAGPVRLGYITLSKDTSRIDFLEAQWSEDDLAQADARASEIVRCVRREHFWPPTDPPPDFSEDFAAICQDRVFAN
ncbi:MAG: PD-(D/E)XK nuclease family protein [Planctomycetaceae bacterium]|nr:PD-(D/E)XK nuclease family protein [Planctomycetales bacterium]MCB9923937.1 PD-(D/E)XK nuclease family protein [Planctomycetaceae bacterium]